MIEITREEVEVLRPLIDARNAEVDAERVERQITAASELAEYRARLQADVPPLQVKHATAIERVNKLKAELAVAQQDALAALRELSLVKTGLTTQVTRLEGEIRGDAHLAIHAAIREWSDDLTQMIPIETRETVTRGEPWTGRVNRETHTYPNVDDVSAYRAAVQAALEAARGMLETPLTAAEVETRLAELRASIPARPMGTSLDMTKKVAPTKPTGLMARTRQFLRRTTAAPSAPPTRAVARSSSLPRRASTPSTVRPRAATTTPGGLLKCSRCKKPAIVHGARPYCIPHAKAAGLWR